MMNKFFLGGISAPQVLAANVTPLNASPYYLSVLWAPVGKINSLAVLNGRSSGGGMWHQIITHPITDNDGEITVAIGQFNTGTAIDLVFKVYPLEDIPACAVFVVNATTGVRHKIAPQNAASKALQKGVSWDELCSITLT